MQVANNVANVLFFSDLFCFKCGAHRSRHIHLFFSFFDTMESMKGHTNKESDENNPKGTDRLATPQLFLLVFFSLMS